MNGALSTPKIWLKALQASTALKSNSPKLLADVVEAWAQSQPDAWAILADSGSMTYAELALKTRHYAQWATAQGMSRGDCVALMAGNEAEVLAAWLGLTRVGVIVALINNNLRGEALAHCLTAAAPKHMLLDKAYLDDVADLAIMSPKLWSMAAGGDLSVALAMQGDQPLGALAVTLAEPALLIYTSGTTGLPKAAIVSHYRIMSWSFWFAAMLNASPQDRLYDCLPLYHSVGGVVAPGAMLAAGGAVVLAPKFSASNFWRDIAHWNCTLFQYIGELCRYLLNAPSHPKERSHRLRIACGNGMAGDVWEAFQTRFAIPKILEFYASTEGNISLYNVEGQVGAIGRVPGFLAHRFPMALVRFDPLKGEPYRNGQGFCERVAMGESGEAIGWIDNSRGAAGQFDGYTNAQDTDKKRLRDVFVTGDQWFRTGDLMRMDAQRFYYFVDRVGDTFRWKGENISTGEVERVLANAPGVMEASVYGVAVAATDGRAGMAALVVKEAFNSLSFCRHVDAALPTYARPVFIRILSAMTITDTFKPKKAALATQGFGPDGTCDPLFARLSGAQDYVPLGPILYADIMAGRVRI